PALAISVGGVADYRSPGHEDAVTGVPARGVACYDAVVADREPIAVRRPRRAPIKDADAVLREDAVLDDGAPADRHAEVAVLLYAHALDAVLSWTSAEHPQIDAARKEGDRPAPDLEPSPGPAEAGRELDPGPLPREARDRKPVEVDSDEVVA